MALSLSLCKMSHRFIYQLARRPRRLRFVFRFSSVAQRPGTQRRGRSAQWGHSPARYAVPVAFGRAGSFFSRSSRPVYAPRAPLTLF